MKTLALGALIYFFLTVAQAGGVISIQGDLLQKCSEKNCQIKMGPQLYVIDLPKLSSSQRIALKKKSAGDSIQETIPMSAVLDVKDIK